ncbi:MAG: hypothetical protein WCX46_03115 [Candidatus Paceibacterota bacterium]
MIFLNIIISIIGGIIGGLITGYFFNFLQKRNTSRGKKDFLRALKQHNKWNYISSGIYIHEDKPEFTIDISDVCKGGVSPIFYGKVSLPETNNNCRVTVRMNVYNKPIMSSIFMSLDGDRYLIPMPLSRYASETVSDESHYIFWDLNSFDFDLYKIIGRAYNKETLAELAKKFNILTS